MTLSMKQRLLVAAIVELERQRTKHPHILRLAGYVSAYMHIDGAVDLEALIEVILAEQAKPADDGEPDVMTVIDPDQWEPCSPGWLTRHPPGDCAAAPRVWNPREQNHYHPKNWPGEPLP